MENRVIFKEDWDDVMSDLVELYSHDRSLIKFIMNWRDKLYELYRDKTAATSIHHAFKGGLLNHTYEMLNMLCALYPTLPELKIERCIIAIMFHDYGKIYDYNEKNEGTEDMYLYGHIFVSAKKLEAELERAGITEYETQRIVHCVLAHHGRLEWGSPVVPCTLEALIIHELDMISSRANACINTAHMEKCFSMGTRVVK